MNPMTDDNKAAAQVILAKLLEIYDVKTLVAYLNGVGENRWSPAIFKRAVANETWHRLSDNEFTYLNSFAADATCASSALCLSIYRSVCRHWRDSSRL